MRDWRRISGILLGLALAATVLAGASALREASSPPQRGSLTSDVDGAFQELVIHYLPEAAGITEVAYRQLLSSLPEEVTVHVVVPDSEAFDDLRRRVGEVPCRLNPVPVGHAMTSWSRDRWLALAPGRAGGPATVLMPRTEDGAEVWPERAGDAVTGRDLAGHLGRDSALALRSDLFFDGGDFVADSETVFVTPRVLRRNLVRVVASRRELVADLERLFKRRVVLLDEAPEHHAGMFMMVAGEGRMLVGDPSLAAPLAAGLEPLLTKAGGADLSPETQQAFDAVARQCAEAGYSVTRIPVLPARDGRTWLTPLNSVLEQRDGRRIVYMPTFEGAETLAEAAADTWRRLGFEVRAIDCTRTFVHFGSLRCLVNVLRRG